MARNAWIRRAEERPQFGMWIAAGNAYTAEICAGSGLDWLMLDTEHVPNDIPAVLAQLQATAAYPIEVLARPGSSDPIEIKRLLDIGVTNLIVPMVDSAEEATAVVAATRYPPEGIRGVGSALARASRWNRISDYLITAGSTISVTVQVESVAGLEALPAIAAVDGVDAVFIGPADLAASLGHLGNPEHPDVIAAIERAIAVIVQSGKRAGVNAFRESVARRYVTAGASFVLVGADVTLLVHGSAALASTYVQDRN